MHTFNICTNSKQSENFLEEELSEITIYKLMDIQTDGRTGFNNITIDIKYEFPKCVPQFDFKPILPYTRVPKVVTRKVLHIRLKLHASVYNEGSAT